MKNSRRYSAIFGVISTFLVFALVYCISDLTSLAVKSSDIDFDLQAMGERPTGDSPPFNYLFFYFPAILAVLAASQGILAYRNLRYALTGAHDGSGNESSTLFSDSQPN